MAINIEILMSRIEKLCADRRISLHAAFIGSGVGKNFKSNMKTANPSVGKVTMLANYFGVTVDYLLGNTDIPNHQKSVAIVTPINEKESKLLFPYRARPEMQAAVDKLLEIAVENDVTLYSAAKSSARRSPSITAVPQDEWKIIEDAPIPDEELL